MTPEFISLEVKSVPEFNLPPLASEKEQLMAEWQAQDQDEEQRQLRGSCALGLGKHFH